MSYRPLLDTWHESREERTDITPGRRWALMEADLGDGADMTVGRTGRAHRVDLEPDHPTPEDSQPDDLQPDDVQPDGVQPDGVQPDGVQPDGEAPDGQVPDGEAPDGGEPEPGDDLEDELDELDEEELA